MPDSFSADVASEVLRAGGNAVDAAVAGAFTLAVTYPEAGNIGGGGFMLTYLDGKATFLDYRETAPAAATRDMYLDANGDIAGDSSLTGHKAAGVPGTVAGLWRRTSAMGTCPGGIYSRPPFTWRSTASWFRRSSSSACATSSSGCSACPASRNTSARCARVSSSASPSWPPRCGASPPPGATASTAAGRQTSSSMKCAVAAASSARQTWRNTGPCGANRCGRSGRATKSCPLRRPAPAASPSFNS